jgi:DNA-binding IclR family transcriptional regulator
MGVRFSDLAASSGLKRATLNRILRVLVEEGAVEQDPASRYYMIGPDVSLFGLARKSRFPVRQLARPGLEQLCRQVGDTVFLSLRTGLDSICIDRLVGDWPLQVLALEIGARRPLGVGVSGVAMLAAMPLQEADRIVATNAHRLPHYHLDHEQLAERVKIARVRGHAFSPNGIVRSTRAIAIAVLDASGQPAAAISIAGMANRLAAARIPTLVALLREQSATLTRLLGERDRQQARAAARRS